MSKVLTSLTVFSVLVAAPSRAAPPCEPFSAGEKTVLSLTYLGATAGTAEISIGREAEEWRFGVFARTDPVFSLFYSVKNRYEATVPAKNFLPLSMRATIDESKQKGFTLQEFIAAAKTASFTDRREHKKKGLVVVDEKIRVPPGTLDVVTALFALRRASLALGSEVRLPVLIGREVSDVTLKVDGQETLPTKIGPVDAWILRASVTKNGVAQNVPESQLWIAKGGEKQILKLKAKVKIGSVVAYLKSYVPGGGPKCLATESPPR